MKCILEKNIKPLRCSSLILKQIICLVIRGLYEQTYLKSRTKVEIYFPRCNLTEASRYSRHICKFLHLDPCQSTQPSHGLYATQDYSVKISDPNKRDLYSVVFGSSLSTPLLICVQQINFCSKQFNHVLLNNLWIQDMKKSLWWQTLALKYILARSSPPRACSKSWLRELPM